MCVSISTTFSQERAMKTNESCEDVLSCKHALSRSHFLCIRVCLCAGVCVHALAPTHLHMNAVNRNEVRPCQESVKEIIIMCVRA